MDPLDIWNIYWNFFERYIESHYIVLMLPSFACSICSHWYKERVAISTSEKFNQVYSKLQCTFEVISKLDFHWNKIEVLKNVWLKAFALTQNRTQKFCESIETTGRIKSDEEEELNGETSSVCWEIALILIWLNGNFVNSCIINKWEWN